MRDVAARAGVSRSLVSTVFRGVPGASAVTRQRILDAAAALGYRPDMRARHLRSGERRLIGITLSAVHPFHVAIVEKLHEAAALQGYEIAVSLASDERPLHRAVDTLLSQRCSAIILVGPTAPDEHIQGIVDSAPDVVFLIADGHTAVSGVDAIRIDDAAALMESVSHLVRLGHRRIWHADGGAFVSASPRRDAYLAAMAAHGLIDEAVILPSGGSSMCGASTAVNMLKDNDLPTAIVCYCDLTACGFVQVMWRNGIRIPEDISIVGFDNIREAGSPYMSITTIEQRPETVVEAIVQTVLERLAGAPAGGLQLLAPGPLVVRASSGAPRLQVAAG